MFDNLSLPELGMIQLITQDYSNEEIAQRLNRPLDDIEAALSTLLAPHNGSRVQLMLEWVTECFGTSLLPTATLFSECRHVTEPHANTRGSQHILAQLVAWRPEATGPVTASSNKFALQAIESSGVPLRTVQFMYMKALLGLSVLPAGLLFFYHLIGEGYSYEEIDTILGHSKKVASKTLRVRLWEIWGMDANQALLDYHRRIPPSAEDRAESRDALAQLTSSQRRVAWALTEYWTHATPEFKRNSDEPPYAAIAQLLGYSDHSTVSAGVRQACQTLGRGTNSRLLIRHYYVAHLAPSVREV